jgi:putative membrane protein
MKKLSDLRNASVNAFDKMYMNMQVEGHQKALNLHQNYAQSGDNASLRTAAGAMVPMISEHLVYAQRISTALVAQR